MGTATNTNANNYQVIENLTSTQIEQFSADTRKKSADALFNQATDLIKIARFNEATQKLRYALKFVDNDPKILNALGETLYEQKKYSESLNFLNKSLEIKSENATKMLIGANYLKLREFNEAIAIFYQVRTISPKSFEVNYNLGLAYEGLKNYETAQRHFSDALEITPNDADTHYRLGLCYHQLGNKEGAIKEYKTLLDLNPTFAEKLRKTAGLPRIEVTPISTSRNGIGTGIGSGSGTVYVTPKPIEK